MTTPALPALAVDGLGLQIGGARILQDVGFAVGAGEMIGVIGPNGAGKTTLFNLISGVMRPTAGSITLNGREITAAPIHRRAKAGLGRTFQTSNLFPRLSVLENVRLAAQAKLGGSFSVLRFPSASDEATRIARGTIDEVGLTGKLTTAGGGPLARREAQGGDRRAAGDGSRRRPARRTDGRGGVGGRPVPHCDHPQGCTGTAAAP